MEKEKEVRYQEQRFDTFTSYLANNTNDVYKKRFSWLSQGVVWAGGAFCMALFSVGGMLPSAVSLAL